MWSAGKIVYCFIVYYISQHFENSTFSKFCLQLSESHSEAVLPLKYCVWGGGMCATGMLFAKPPYMVKSQVCTKLNCSTIRINLGIIKFHACEKPCTSLLPGLSAAVSVLWRRPDKETNFMNAPTNSLIVIVQVFLSAVEFSFFRLFPQFCHNFY